MKYENMVELAEAFKKGELEGYTLMLDTDNSFLWYSGPVPDGLNEDEAESFCDRKTDEASDWFHGNGYADVGDACKAAGIPAEWV